MCKSFCVLTYISLKAASVSTYLVLPGHVLMQNKYFYCSQNQDWG